jgi:hypothetical protein
MFLFATLMGRRTGLAGLSLQCKALGLVTNTAEGASKGKYVSFGAMVSTFAAGTSSNSSTAWLHIFIVPELCYGIYMYICFCVQVKLGVFDQIYFQRFPFKTRTGCKIVLV